MVGFFVVGASVLVGVGLVVTTSTEAVVSGRVAGSDVVGSTVVGSGDESVIISGSGGTAVVV